MSAPRLVRAVVDTNLLVRGLLRRRPDSQAVLLFDAIRERRFSLVVSSYLLDELRAVLQSPELRPVGPRPQRAIRRAVRGLRRIARVVPGDFEVNMVGTDPKDNPVVACALEGDAEYVVTDDRRDLLPLGAVRVAGYRVVRMVTAKAFLDLLAREER